MSSQDQINNIQNSNINIYNALFNFKVPENPVTPPLPIF